MAPGAGNKFGTPLLETEVFRKQTYCVEESTCVIVGTFLRPPQSFGARGIVPPSLRPCLRVSTSTIFGTSHT